MEEYTHKKTLLDKIEEKPIKYLFNWNIYYFKFDNIIRKFLYN